MESSVLSIKASSLCAGVMRTYFMLRTEVGGQKPEVRRQKTEPEKHVRYCGRPPINGGVIRLIMGEGFSHFIRRVLLGVFSLFRFGFLVFFLFFVVVVWGARRCVRCRLDTAHERMRINIRRVTRHRSVGKIIPALQNCLCTSLSEKLTCSPAG